MTHNFSHSNWHVKKKESKKKEWHKKEKTTIQAKWRILLIASIRFTIELYDLWNISFLSEASSIQLIFSWPSLKNYIREIALWLDLLLLLLFFFSFEIRRWRHARHSLWAPNAGKIEWIGYSKALSLLIPKATIYIYIRLSISIENTYLFHKKCADGKSCCVNVRLDFILKFRFFFPCVIPCNKPNAITLRISQLVNCPQWSDRRKTTTEIRRKKNAMKK